ncbi:MAG: hypothetical protein NT051_00445 [Candidatus Micrarchaeota archaeon]|nr:hypothetical protein [Candidatus Micrarchaeota archaeon]
MDDSPLAELDKKWRSACKVILGGEVRSLLDCEGWLMELKQPLGSAKSSISGKELTLVSPDFPAGARYVSMDEASQLAAAPFSMDEIKDIDSLFSAASERFAYSGNLVFGNSQFVEASTDISDSFYIYKSARVAGSKLVACSTIVKDSNSLFGCNVASKDELCIRCNQFTSNTRCLEATITTSSSDCYFTYDCLGCQNAMFSFGQRNGVNMIGNLSLPKGKYLSLKSALLEQIRAELMAKKRLPNFSQILFEAAKEKAALPLEIKKAARKYADKVSPAQIQKAFDETCSIVLGTYENLKALPDSRYINAEEARALAGTLKLTEKEAESLTLKNSGKSLSRIAYFTPQFHEGTNLNVYACPIILWSSDCEAVHGCIYVKKSAYSTWPRDSDHVFGCAFAFASSFSIKCYNSFGIQRCFEVDSARSCTGCYYSHNIENCHDSILCCNAKNLRYAIGNVAVGKEKFLQAKAILLGWVNGNLEKKQALPLDIYSIAGYKKGKKG